MNPWDILVWVAVICLSLILIAATYAIVRGAFGGGRRPKRESSTPVIQNTSQGRNR